MNFQNSILYWMYSHVWGKVDLDILLMLALYILTMCIMCVIMMFYSQLEHDDETFEEVSAAVG